MNRRSIVLSMAATLCLTLAVACGGGNGHSAATPSPEAATPAPTAAVDEPGLRAHEAELRDAVPDFFRSVFAASGGVHAYSYVAADFKKVCPLSDFLATMAFARVFLGDIKESDVQVDVTDVRYAGDRAYVKTKVSINGDPLMDASDDDKSFWIFQDGGWRISTDDAQPCSLGNGDVTPEATTPATGPGLTRSEPAAYGTAVRSGDYEVSIISVDLDAGDTLRRAAATESVFRATPVPGRRPVLVRVSVRNVGAGDATIHVSPNDFGLTGSNNQLYEPYSDETSCNFTPDEIDAKLFPGGSAEGNVCFQVPEDESSLLLVLTPLLTFDRQARRYLALQ
jgi:hypothetical protein